MNWREISIAVPQKTSETHPHAAAATRRTYRWLLEPILPLIERFKNFREARLALIVKRAGRLILSSQCRSSTSLTGLSLARRAGTLYNILGRALRLPFAIARDRHPPAPFHLPEPWNWWKSCRPRNHESLPCVSSAERGTRPKDSSREAQE